MLRLPKGLREIDGKYYRLVKVFKKKRLAILYAKRLRKFTLARVFRLKKGWGVYRFDGYAI
ncbi:hypothetical protein J7L81_00380 [Candidatus Aerophobetes bacterium]|nr:hypothetical protein [Candidatus Aerophobetes bacterium]